MISNSAQEIFTSDELVELGCALEKAKDDARRALSILKVLANKTITG